MPILMPIKFFQIETKDLFEYEDEPIRIRKRKEIIISLPFDRYRSFHFVEQRCYHSERSMNAK